jgi:hypothetical protein
MLGGEGLLRHPMRKVKDGSRGQRRRPADPGRRVGAEGTGPNPTDRPKKGRKRSLLTEGQGVPLRFAPADANLNDFKLARATIASIPVELP